MYNDYVFNYFRNVLNLGIQQHFQVPFLERISIYTSPFFRFSECQPVLLKHSLYFLMFQPYLLCHH